MWHALVTATKPASHFAAVGIWGLTSGGKSAICTKIIVQLLRTTIEYLQAYVSRVLQKVNNFLKHFQPHLLIKWTVEYSNRLISTSPSSEPTQPLRTGEGTTMPKSFKCVSKLKLSLTHAVRKKNCETNLVFAVQVWKQCFINTILILFYL